MDEAHDPLLGRTVDERYRLDEVIGEGGMGVVYRATQLSVGRPVAVKVLTSAAARDVEVARRFEIEARVISTLRHPNTLKLVDFGRTAGGRPVNSYRKVGIEKSAP